MKKSIVILAVCLLLLSATHARAERMCSIVAEGAISNEQMCFADSSSINVSIPTGETSKTPAAAIQLEPFLCAAMNEAVDCDGGPACIPSAGWSDLQQCLYWVNFGGGYTFGTGSLCLTGFWNFHTLFLASGTWDVVCVSCGQDSDCDDGVACNGVETCVDNWCNTGTSPCA